MLSCHAFQKESAFQRAAFFAGCAPRVCVCFFEFTRGLHTGVVELAATAEVFFSSRGSLHQNPVVVAS